ncbi:MAG: LacI family DNA-binding transcriptional regulator [Verrucomicrobia bacterium]|nr:LacI family DNA-binding transcriptional regulator [Verrucomicrobiota bacterium]MBV8484090.1 LacI family DNA-binding transcriptional regulator [Verrucomicrobiota bacterium]
MPQSPQQKKSSFDRVTLYEVAEVAGVSHQTVSRVVNGSPLVAERTRARVLKAIARMNYRPNSVARNLAARRSALIGVITFAVESYGPSHLIISLSEVARKLGYHVVVASAEYPVLDEIRRCGTELRGHGVDGVIVILPTILRLRALEEVFGDAPVVVMGARRQHRYTAVEIDHELGSQQATEYLIMEGHREIACISGPLDWDCSSLRRVGWRRALEGRKLPLGPAVECDWSAEGGYAATQKLLDSRARFTALVAGNDQIALGAMEALWENGIEIPGQVSVIGFDNMPESKFFRPPLTTVNHDFDLLSATSLHLVTQAISDPQAPRLHHKIAPDLIVRQSAGPIAGEFAAGRRRTARR